MIYKYKNVFVLMFSNKVFFTINKKIFKIKRYNKI